MPVSSIVWPAEMIPLSSEAIAVIGLNVEPVGYCAAIARLSSGAPLAWDVSRS